MLNELQKMIAVKKAEMNTATMIFFETICDADDDDFLEDLRFKCFNYNVDTYWDDLLGWLNTGDNADYMDICIEEGYFEPSNEYRFYEHLQSAQRCFYSNTCDPEKALETFSLAYIMCNYENATDSQLKAVLENAQWLQFTKQQVTDSIDEIMMN